MQESHAMEIMDNYTIMFSDQLAWSSLYLYLFVYN